MAELVILNNNQYYTKNVEINQEILDEILTSLNVDEEKTEKSRNLYFRNATKIIDSLYQHTSILVNGEVQSGKTNNLILAAHSLNMAQKYDLIIYLSGRHNIINDQNHLRFYEQMTKFDQYMVSKAKTLDKINETVISKILDGKTLLVNMLKLPQKMKSIIEFVDYYNFSFLVINDEGDDTTMTDTGKKLFSKLISMDNRKKIITISGTPYKNLMNDNLYDDYLFLESSEYYKGIEKFDYTTVNNEDGKLIQRVVYTWLEDIKNSNERSQLLINSSLSTIKHTEIKKTIEEMLKEIKLNSNDKEILNLIKDIQFNSRISISNGENTFKSKGGKEIIIGGHNLSRGVTFKYLSHQLLFSETKSKISAGALLQRARWCGYRNFEVKIFISENIFNALKEIVILQKMTINYNFENHNYSDIIKQQKFKHLEI